MYNINHSLRGLSGILVLIYVLSVFMAVNWCVVSVRIIHLCTTPEKNSNPSSPVLCLQLETCYYDRLGNQC